MWNNLLSVGAGLVSALNPFASRFEARKQQREENAFNAEQAQLNRDFQREERLQTQAYNEMMWNKNNEYNSPSNQLKLAMDAGINPNIFIGGLNGRTNGPVTSSPMSGSQASIGGSIASGLLLHDAQVANLFASARKAESEAKGQEIANSFAPSLNDNMIKKAQAEIAEIGSRKGFNESQTKQIEELLPLLKGKNEQEIANMQAEFDVLFAELEKIRKESKSIDSTIALNESIANKNNEDARFRKWENDFRDKWGVAPGAGLIDGIIQLAVSGEKGEEISYNMVKTVLNVAKGVITSPIRLTGERLHRIVNPAGENY